MVYYPTFGDVNCEGAGEFCGWDTGWGALVLAAMIIVLSFYTIVYMLSFVLQSEPLKKNAKAHLVDTIFNALLAILIIVILENTFTLIRDHFEGATVSCSTSGEIRLGEGGNPFDLVKCRLMEKASFVSQLYEAAYIGAREPFKKFTVMWGLFGISIYMQGNYLWNKGFSEIYTEMEKYRLLANVCVSLLIGLNAYISAVDYISENMLRMFLPIGIVLRAIPPTKGIGAFFIAVAVSFYIIFPFVFAITDPSFIQVPLKYVDVTDTEGIISPFPSFSGAVAMFTMGPQHPSASAVFGNMDISQISSEVSKFYYTLLLHPVVVLSITLIFVRYLTMLFGGEAQEIYRLAGRVV